MTISTRCRELAERAKVSAKSMHCRANADARAAALKAASVYVMAAGWSETMGMAALAERCREQGNAYLASAKPYKAGPKRSAYVRGAAALFEVARWAEEEVPRHWAEVVEDAGISAVCAEEPPAPRRRYARRTPPVQDSTEE
jgi:hypothetical protein